MAFMKYREPNQVKWVGTRPGHNGTQVVRYAIANGAIVAVYTVPAGNVLYLCTVTMGYAAVAGGIGYVEILDDLGAPFAYPCIEVIPAGPPTRNSLATYWPPMELPAAYIIRVASTVAGLGTYATIYGWVE